MEHLLLLGNESIARGALGAGVVVAAGYPGTTSTVVIETLHKEKDRVECERESCIRNGVGYSNF